MWTTIIIILLIAFGISGIAGLLAYFYPPIGDCETYVSSNPKNEPMVRIHYGWDVGTSIAVVPTSEIERYVRDFEILSIKPHIEETKSE